MRAWAAVVVLAGGCASDERIANPLAGAWQNGDSRRTYNDDDCSYTAVAGAVMRDGYWLTGVDPRGNPLLLERGDTIDSPPGCIDDSQVGDGVRYFISDDRLLVGGMPGSREVAPGSHWYSNRTSPGGGGSCSTISAWQSITLNEANATTTSMSCCLPANMCSMGTTTGTWTPTAEGFTATWDQMTYDYALVGDLLADPRQVLTRVE